MANEFVSKSEIFCALNIIVLCNTFRFRSRISAENLRFFFRCCCTDSLHFSLLYIVFFTIYIRLFFSVLGNRALTFSLGERSNVRIVYLWFLLWAAFLYKKKKKILGLFLSSLYFTVLCLFNKRAYNNCELCRRCAQRFEVHKKHC